MTIKPIALAHWCFLSQISQTWGHFYLIGLQRRTSEARFPSSFNTYIILDYKPIEKFFFIDIDDPMDVDVANQDEVEVNILTHDRETPQHTGQGEEVTQNLQEVIFTYLLLRSLTLRPDLLLFFYDFIL